jgi:hypothetical protein
MTSLAPPIGTTPTFTDFIPTAADGNAQANVDANVRAIQSAQPGLVDLVEQAPARARWTLARDGSLTATIDRGWWGGNSLPARSAREMLKGVEGAVAMSCMVAPTHAAQVRAFLEHIEPQQGVIVVQPDVESVRITIRCEDFSNEITRKRLWLAVGPDWAAQLDRLLTDLPGLPVPGRFIRLPDVDDEVASAVMSGAQAVFGAHITGRAERLVTVRVTPARRRGFVTKVCVVAPSRFRLWSNAGRVLAETLSSTTPQHVAASWEVVDTDDLTTASPLAVAQAVSRCDAIVTADVGRSDNPSIASSDLPWVTWVTTPRVPRFDPSGSKDRLILADRSWVDVARDAGWTKNKVTIAGWPSRASSSRPSTSGPAHLALLTDVSDLKAPTTVEDYSSQRVVWDAIRDELTGDPFVIGADPGSYLDAKLRKHGISPDAVDRALFVERLILPAYTIGLASVLLEKQVPLLIYGAGWDKTACRDHARGPVRTRDEFDAIVDAAAALVRPWPLAFAHEIDVVGRPVIGGAGMTRNAFVEFARRSLDRSASGSLVETKPLRADTVLALVTS